MTSKKNKFNAQRIYYDPTEDKEFKEWSEGLLRFDSKFELSVYKALCVFFGQHRIELKPCVPLIPKTERNKAINWNIDFCLLDCDAKKFHEGKLYFEAKGFETEGFKLRYSLFRYTYPENQILVVHSIKELIEGLIRLGLHSHCNDAKNFNTGKRTKRNSQLNLFR